MSEDRALVEGLLKHIAFMNTYTRGGCKVVHVTLSVYRKLVAMEPEELTINKHGPRLAGVRVEVTDD